MKLLRCYIENFGKLHSFHYDFNDGLNVIEKENGFGKTTFATFIKSMFYGLDASKSEKSERKRYTPWQGGVFGGNIDFEIDGKRYRIERFFGSKASDDTFKIYDLATNLETKDYTENVGEEIFKINKEGYERSTYIPQGQIEIEMEDSLNAKLGNILEGDNDVNTSDVAIKRLSELMKEYKKIGNKGLLNEKKELLNQKERELEKSKFDSENLDIKEKKLNEIKEKLDENETKRTETQDKLSKVIEQGRKQAKLETYNNILESLKGKQERYDELNSFLNDGEPKGNEFQSLNTRIVEIEDKIQIEENNKKEIETKKEELNGLYKKQIMLWKTLTIVSAVVILIGLVLLFLNIPKYIGAIIGIIGIGLLVFSVIKYKDRNINIQIENLKKSFEDIDKNIENLNSLKQEVEDSKSRMLAYLKNELTLSFAELENVKKQKNDFEEANNIDNLKRNEIDENISEEELNQEIIKLSNNINDLIDEKNQVKNQIEFLENKIDENEYLENDIQNLKEDIVHLEEKYSILDKTKSLLETAKNSFSSNYLKDMQEGFEKYFNLIDDKELKTDIDINLGVKLDINGSKKEAKYFSAGYKDLIYICMRLSLVKALFKGELPFVILDDPFVNLDNEKTKKAISLLKEFSKYYQVIYFVCNNSRI